MSSIDTTQPIGLITIERVVTFVVGPLVIAGSGTLSAWLSTKVGVHVSSSAIVGAFATGGLTVGAAVYKWLDGRSKSTLQKAEHVAIEGHMLLQKEGVSLDVQNKFISVGEADIKKLAEDAAAKAVAGLNQATTNLQPTESMIPAADEMMETITPSLIDPAPSTPLPPPPVAPPVAAAHSAQSAHPLAGPPLPADPPTLQQLQPVVPPQ